MTSDPMTSGSLPTAPLTLDPAFTDEATISLTKVTKWFGQKVAVSDVSCSFGAGVTGLLGPNGAGKTTMLRLIAGILGPSEGTLTIFGVDPRANNEVYRRIGLVPEEGGVYGFLTARAYVEYAARLGGGSNPAAAARRALHEVAMEDSIDRPIAEFSKGMRQRTKVAAALVNEPTILILDEPLNGTDPVQRAKLIDLFRRMGQSGHTVIVSSHVLAEVERMADRILAMVDGRLAAAGDITAIREAMSDIPFRVRVATGNPRRVASRLVEEHSIRSVTVDGDLLHVETGDLRDLGMRLPAVCSELDIPLTGFQPEDESLESVFRYLVGRR